MIRIPLVLFFVIYISFLPFSYHFSNFYQTDLVVLSSFTFFILGAIHSLINRKPIFYFDTFSVLSFIFLLFMLFQYGFKTTAYPYATRQYFVPFFSYWLLLQLFIRYIDERKWIQIILYAILVSVYAVSIVVLYQHLTGGQSLAPYVSLHPNRNNIAAFLELTGMLALGFACYRLMHLIHRKTEKEGTGWSDSGFLNGIFLFALALFAAFSTLSRFSLVSVFAGGFVFVGLIAIRKRRDRFLLILLGVLAVAFAFASWGAGEAIYARILHHAKNGMEHYWSLNARIPFWQRAWPLFLEFKWFGTGFGTFAQTFTGFHRVDDNYFSFFLLNDYYEILLEGGVIGFLLCLVTWISFFAIFIKKILKVESYFTKSIGIGILSGMASFFTHEFLISNILEPTNCFYLMVLIGMMHALFHSPRTEILKRGKTSSEVIFSKEKESRHHFPLILIVFLVFLIAFGFYARDFFAQAFLGKHPIEMSYKRAGAMDSENSFYPVSLGILQSKKASETEDELRQHQKYLEALYSVKRGIDLNPYQLEHRLVYAGIASSAYLPAQAIQIFEEFRDKARFDLEYHLNFGFICFHLAPRMSDEAAKEKCIQKGLEALKEALQLNPSYASKIIDRKLISTPEPLRSRIKALY